jgi:hypothetical protein
MDEMEGLWVALPEGAQIRGMLTVVAAREGRLVGCDQVFSFAGTYRFNGDRIVVEIAATRYGPSDVPTIWGGFGDSASLEMSGFFGTQAMQLGGHFKGNNREGETRVTLMKLRPW